MRRPRKIRSSSASGGSSSASAGRDANDEKNHPLGSWTVSDLKALPRFPHRQSFPISKVLISQYLQGATSYWDLRVGLFWLGFALLDEPTHEEPTLSVVPLCKDLDTYVDTALELGYSPTASVHLAPSSWITDDRFPRGVGNCLESTEPLPVFATGIAGGSSGSSYSSRPDRRGSSTGGSSSSGPGPSTSQHRGNSSFTPCLEEAPPLLATGSSSGTGPGSCLSMSRLHRPQSAGAQRNSSDPHHSHHKVQIRPPAVAAAALPDSAADMDAGGAYSSCPAGAGSSQGSASQLGSSSASSGGARAAAAAGSFFQEQLAILEGVADARQQRVQPGERDDGSTSGEGDAVGEGLAAAAADLIEAGEEVLSQKVKLLYAGGWSDSSDSDGQLTPPASSSSPSHNHNQDESPGQRAGGLDASHVEQFTVTFISMEEDFERSWCLCPFCLEDMQLGDELCRLPCMHTFHRRCVHAWLERDRRCMLCRLDITRPGG